MALINVTNTPIRQHLKAHSQTGRRRYDSFTLGTRLGSGSFGLVYTATDAKRRPIALKIVKLENLKSVEATLEPIQVETQSWRACNGHHNVVKLYACKRVDNTFYFSMEEAATDVYTLTTAIGDQQHRLPEPIVQRLMAQALDGLLFIHSRGVIHRDVKPDNMLLSRDGRLLHTDFGWSRALPLGQKARTRGGTAEYLAPEIFHSRSYKHSLDLWALGMCMYEWIVGNNYLLQKMEGKYNGYKEKIAFLEVNQAFFPRCSRSTDLMHSGVTQPALAVLQGLLAMNPEARLGYSEEDPRRVYASLMDMPFFKEVKHCANIPAEVVSKACALKRRLRPERVQRDMKKLDDWEKAELPSEYDNLFAQFEWSCDDHPEKATNVRVKQPLRKIGPAAALGCPSPMKYTPSRMPVKRQIFPQIPDFVPRKVGRVASETD
ncbi:unnamed protein product, partial [Mesorhabditis spiculigera]